MDKDGHWLRKSTNGLTVVFIHGINSSDQCWENAQGISWPNLLKQEKNLEQIGLYLFSYRTGFNTGSYSLGDIVDSFNEHLSNLDRVLDSDRVLFVCHSMGGIIARRFIVREQSNLIDKGLKHIGLFLVASPSLGSDYANMLGLLSAFLGHTQATALKFSQSNVWLNDLDKDFINLKEKNRLNIIGKELIEDLSLRTTRFFGFKKQIVEPFSGARYFGQSFKVPGADHISISKPANFESIQHRLLVQFIKDFDKSSQSDQRNPESLQQENPRVTFQNEISGGKVYQANTINITERSGSGDVNQATTIPNNLPRSGAIAFVGRDDKLDALQQELQGGDRLAITAVSRPSAVQGMGGIGKTELALQYAIVNIQNYPGGVCWLQARDREIATQIVSFAKENLGIKPPDDLEADAQVRFTWQRWPIGDALIVLDDVTDYDAIASYLPPSDPRFKVLITTRLNLGSSVKAIEIDELSDESAIALLKSIIGAERIESQIVDVGKLCEWVGNLPLGLELMGRFLARKSDWAIAKLLKRLESKRLDARALVEGESGMTASLGVAAALELSWAELSDEERDLGCLLGMFAVAPIPWNLVEQCFEDVDKDDVEEWRDGLRDRSLVRRVSEGEYQLHQIVQEFFREKLKVKGDDAIALKQAFGRVMVAQAKILGETPTLEQIESVRGAIAHLEETAHQWVDVLSDDDKIWPFVGIGRFYQGQGNYSLAEPWYCQSYEDLKRVLGDEHPSVSNSLNNLANLYRAQGRYEAAEPLYEEALAISKRVLGDEHPSVANSLNNLAFLYSAQGRYEAAEPLYEEALAIRKRVLGDEHPDVATSYFNLGVLYHDQGQYQKAKSLYLPALEIYHNCLGNSHPNTQALLSWLNDIPDHIEPLLLEDLGL